jgi:hypothetical protein
MLATLQVLLAVISWFVFVFAPAARLAYDDRGRSNDQMRGVSLFPGWPLLPLLFLAPLPFLGAQHTVNIAIAWLHVAILVWSLIYIAYWLIRARAS